MLKQAMLMCVCRKMRKNVFEKSENIRTHRCILQTSVTERALPLCSSHKWDLQSWGYASKRWTSVNFSRSQCGTAAHVVRWAVLPPSSKPESSTRGSRQGRVGLKNKKDGLDMLQPLVDKRQGQWYSAHAWKSPLGWLWLVVVVVVAFVCCCCGGCGGCW